MHDRNVHAAVGDGASRTCVRQPSLLLDRQGIHVRTQQYMRALPVAEQTDDAGPADAGGHLESRRGKLGGDQCGRAGLVEPELGVGMQIGVDRGQVESIVPLQTHPLSQA